MESENMPPTGQISPKNKTGKTKKIVISTVVILLLITLGFFGWQYLSDSETSWLSIGDQTSDNAEAEEEIIEFDDGTTERMTQGLADDFPSQIPIFEPSTAIDTARIDYNESVDLPSPYWDAAFTTASSSSEVDEFYRQALETNDWEVLEVIELDDVIDISAYNSRAKLRVGVLIEIEKTDNVTSFTISTWGEEAT